ncbi:MAG: hypothetical protein JOZ62_15085, partial [Acidobacteriaceae bacterium]|nr:hypothetical protein [Acidobacteriaceae bacterium]
GPHLADEISKESWLQARHIQNWISVGDTNSSATISTDASFVRLSDGAVRGEMLRAARYTSVKVVRGDTVASMDYPPPGTYTFKYSISSGNSDWRRNRSYETGLDFNNPLLPVSVVDNLSKKTLPPSQSFLSIEGDDIVLSALKKADDSDGIVARFYEVAGNRADTPINFLGRVRRTREINLLEQSGSGGTYKSTVSLKPFEIKTILLQ